MIPNNNEDECCYIRINQDVKQTEENFEQVYNKKNRSVIENGGSAVKHYWKEGRGVMFDDTFLHDAHNGGDEERVVLFLDIARKLPWYLHLYNKIALFLAYNADNMRVMRESAILKRTK